LGGSYFYDLSPAKESKGEFSPTAQKEKTKRNPGRKNRRTKVKKRARSLGIFRVQGGTEGLMGLISAKRAAGKTHKDDFPKGRFNPKKGPPQLRGGRREVLLIWVQRLEGALPTLRGTKGVDSCARWQKNSGESQQWNHFLKMAGR